VRGWREGLVPLETYGSNTDEAPRAAEERIASHERKRGAVGFVGLGKMGANIARNAIDHGWTVVGFNRTVSVAEGMADEGLHPARTFDELVSALKPPRVVWLMVPAGKPVDSMLFGADGRGTGLADKLEAGDIVIDGGNSFYRDSLERSSRLAERGIGFLDIGTSGGPSGARHGACLMVGGDRELFEQVETLIADLALPGGYRFFDGVGAGHFVKMVHNGIEYGMMQAIAEGFGIMHAGPYELDLEQVADLYQHGSVVESRLIGWLADSFGMYGSQLAAVSGIVGHTGEGEWTVDVARSLGLDTRVIADALRFRVESERAPMYVGRILTAMRHQFGGHALDGPERPARGRTVREEADRIGRE
jgi:6-phosphogluconate dehydrogenase